MPGVAVFALPPNFAPAAGEDMVGGEGRILGWVPFGGYARIFCGEIVEAGEHLGVGAVWAAAASLGAAGDGGLILVAFVADPPDFFVAGGSDLLWGEGAILGWVPLGCNGWILAGEVVLARDDHFAGADWAAAAIDAGRNNCAPFMAFVANPPDFAPGAGDDVARREVAIFGRVPLASELGIIGSEVVFAGVDLFACADWATAAAAAAGDGCLISVAFGADPPDFAPTAGDNVGWSEGAVFGWMPLGGELGIEAGEIVLASLDELIGANGTTGAVDTRFYLCPPFVAVVTLPPHESMAAGQDIGWRERGIFGWVPLTSEIWIGCGEVVHAGQRQASAAIWAACAAAGAGVDGGLPVVTVGTGPPDFAFAAVADAVGGEWRVARAVPLGEKIFALVAMAIF